MKYPLAPAGYSFNAAAKTITFTGTVPAAISNIMHVANISRGVIYFQPQAGPLFSGTYAGGVLTLACSTTGHANGDQLLIMYDDGATVLPVSGPLTDAQLRAAVVPTAPNITRGGGAIDANTTRVTMASDGPTVSALTSIDSKTAALINGRSGVEPLGQPGVARQLAFTSASANTALTSTCRRISILARTSDARFLIGSSSQTASSTSHYIAAGERMELVVPATPNIAVIRAGTVDGTLEVMELL